MSCRCRQRESHKGSEIVWEALLTFWVPMYVADRQISRLAPGIRMGKV